MATRSRSDYVYKMMKTPLGELKLVASDKGIAGVLWMNGRAGRSAQFPAYEDILHPVLCEVEKQLTEYFAGTRTTFNVKLDLQGTEFQKSVWKALLTIPYGKTVSYADIARKIRKPAAVRAVGNANNRNPVCIITPCHRVISASGDLSGYAGGIRAKAALLKLESTHVV